ncbi:MAG: sulfite exporter TauE/SafE family protein [Pseudomonadota bacterium]
MEGVAFWILASLAAFCLGMSKGGVPVVSAMSVPLLALVISPVVAAGMLLPVYIAADVFGVYAYRKHCHLRIFQIFAIAMPVGVLIGYLTSSSVPDAVVTLVIGVTCFCFALYNLLRPTLLQEPRDPPVGSGLFWGTITGFTSFVSHAGAPPYQVYVLPLGLDKMTFAGTMTVAFAYINLVKLIPYYALGQITLANLQIAVWLVVPAVFGVFIGVKLVRHVPQKLFFQIVAWALFLISLRLIWSGTTGVLA